MQLFYDPDLQTGLHQLREAEARHAAQVLRKRNGDRIDLVDGKGGWFEATILDISKRGCQLDVQELRREPSRAKHQTTLLIAPTKNIDRFEWALEKACEIGVDCIQPVLTHHSERKRIRLDRCYRVLESAMKQCLRAWLPTIKELLPFEEAIAASSGTAYLPYLGAADVPLLRDTYQPGSDVTIAIGPEGGFSATEADLAKQQAYQWVSLGPNRLRTETAAIAALHTVESLSW